MSLVFLEYCPGHIPNGKNKQRAKTAKKARRVRVLMNCTSAQ